MNSAKEIDKASYFIITSLARLAENRDPETGFHLERTKRYVRVIAEELSKKKIDTFRFHESLNEDYIDTLSKCSPLHDIGKVGIPDNILMKPGKLTDEEFKIMKEHTIIGGKALESSEAGFSDRPFLQIAREMAYYHHEKYDGTGYPFNLKKNQIPLSASIMALADVYDALRTKRPYKKSFSHNKTREIMQQGCGKHFDPAMIRAFLQREEDFITISEKFSGEEEID